jgi:hypothetical protein
MFSFVIIRNNEEVFNKYINPCLNDLPKNGFELHIEDTKEKPAAAYNKALSKTTNQYIFFVHADVTFKPTLLQGLTDSIKAQPNFGAMGIYGALWQGQRRVIVKANTTTHHEVKTLDSCGILINRQHNLKFDDVTFDDFHFYVEDYCCQVIEKGLKVYTFLEDRINHHSATMTIMGSNWGRCREYKNRLRKKWNKEIPTTSGGNKFNGR